MPFDPELAAIRFGCGLSPLIPPPDSAGAILDRLRGPDTAAASFPIPGVDLLTGKLGELKQASRALRDLRQARQQGTGRVTKADVAEGEEAFRTLKERMNQDLNRIGYGALAHVLLRRAHTADGFRERVTAFWEDHFAAGGDNNLYVRLRVAGVESAIRPHVAGRFSDLLFSAATNPVMLHFLDQTTSAGPGSPAARKWPGQLGLNENLARELLELHTLGLDGGYTQDDVRNLAKLLTGLTHDGERGVHFNPRRAEPGAETVLGRSYGGDAPSMADIRAVLDDLAAHPATARHLSRKLCVHFVADRPDERLVAAVEGAWIDSDGDLTAVYAAMLDHPAAWDAQPGNVKRPMDFIGSAMRALAVAPEALTGDRAGRVRALLAIPSEAMGQNWDGPPGPDGWPEADSAWSAPQRLAARLRWAMAAPKALVPILPDPRRFLEEALGARAPEVLESAVRSAADRSEGVALVLVSPAFQRM